MPRKRHAAVPVLEYFRTQNQEVCNLTLAIVKDLMAMRFTGSSVPRVGSTRTRKTKTPQLVFLFDTKSTEKKEG